MSASRDPKWWTSIRELVCERVRELSQRDLAALAGDEQVGGLGLQAVAAARREVDQML